MIPASPALGVYLRAALVGLLLPFASLAQKAEPNRPVPLAPAEAQKQGRELVAALLAQKPAENATNTGSLTNWPERGAEHHVRVRFEIYSTPTNWVSVYRTGSSTGVPAEVLTIIHSPSGPNQYLLETSAEAGSTNAPSRTLAGDAAMIPFAGSDFWMADLGLEFLHWPKQWLLRKEMRRSRACSVLESTNPNPRPGAYSRVVSWIDNESGGVLHAEAYDFAGELLKEFDPDSVKKIQGRYELEGIEIRNVQKESKSQIRFDLPSKR